VSKELQSAQDNLDKVLPAVLTCQTVATFIDDWLNGTVKPTAWPNTLRSYRQMVAHIVPTLGDIQLAPHATERSGDAVLRQALNQAMRWGMVYRNAAALASPRRANHGR
jgi:hypothetical protein